MLFETFQHIPRIGPALEKRLWKQGIHDWNAVDANAGLSKLGISSSVLMTAIDESKARLAVGDAGYFYSGLPCSEQWRLYRDFYDQSVFLDIETTGVYAGDQVTTVVTLAHGKLHYFINGENLNELGEHLKPFKVVLTFNGKSFDGPFLKRTLNIDLPPAHVDLLHPCRKLGLKGGLKQVERLLGMARADSLTEVSGMEAVILWRRFRATQNEKYLRTLLAYNAQDVISLQHLAAHVYRALASRLPILRVPHLPDPDDMMSCYQPDDDAVREIQSLRWNQVWV